MTELMKARKHIEDLLSMLDESNYYDDSLMEPARAFLEGEEKVMSEPMTDYRLWADEVEKLKMQIAVLRKDNERLKRLAVDFEAEAKVYRIQNGKLLKAGFPEIGMAADVKVHKIDYDKPAHPGIVLKPDMAS